MEESGTSRRKFIKDSVRLGALGMLASGPFASFASAGVKRLTILHTNDWHSRIDPFPANAGSLAGLGGAEVRAAIIRKIRHEEKNVLLFDAGDIFQGTPYFNFFKGELEYRLMSEMGYDAATLGNHDFDNGLDGIVSMLPHADFSFINCNYDFTGNILHNRIQPYKVFEKDGIRIGVLGVGVELDGLVPVSLYGNTVYNEPVKCANETAALLKDKKKCDLVICLSHLGYSYSSDKISDILLAQRSKNIDLIIGGHTHTFMPAPDVQKNLEGKPVTIHQVGWAGVNLGRIDYLFSPSGKPVGTGVSGCIPVSVSNC
jgi:5'-nucleotidase